MAIGHECSRFEIILKPTKRIIIAGLAFAGTLTSKRSPHKAESAANNGYNLNLSLPVPLQAIHEPSYNLLHGPLCPQPPGPD